MLSKKHRLPIQSLLTSPAATKRSRYFTVKTFTSKLLYGRFGVVISKHVAPKATQRNRIKRIIFNAVKANVAERAGVDTLIIIIPAISELKSKDAIINELYKLL